MSQTIPRRMSPEASRIRLIGATDQDLLTISRETHVGLNLEEMTALREYFEQKGRNPTDVEVQTFGQTWSEHCFHKTFKGNVITEKGRVSNLLKTYIVRATSELRKPWCISVFEDNAGIMRFNRKYAITAKVETHNHPSAIEPFGGAATGVGGVIRDILGVWADPIASTDVLGFGPLDYEYEKLPQGIKHPKYVFRGVVAGIGCYGNNMGIPTVNGAIYFDESYVGNVVVFCGCIGLLPVGKFAKKAKAGDVLLLAGGRTGRDGIHGVTFASAELTKDSEEISRPAVQIANPIEEEKLKRAIIEIREKELGSGITDLGGGGLSSSVGEMAHRFGCGARINLEKVPLKERNLSPWEIYISESQERMLLLIPPKNLAEVREIFDTEDVEATPIGELTEDENLVILYKGSKVAELEIAFLFNPPRPERSAIWKGKPATEPAFHEPRDLQSTLLKLLAAPNITSREKVVRTYDHEVKGNTVLKPLHGSAAGPSDAAIIKPIDNSWKGVTIACGINPNYGKIDSYWMAASAIDEAIRNSIAVGGRRIALLDNFVWGNPEKPSNLKSLVEACKACYKFAKGFKTPFVSGKDSLYNESPLGSVTPTLLITAIGILPDIRKTVTLDLKSPGNPVYIVGETFKELGGSAYYRENGFIGNLVPKVRLGHAKQVMDAVIRAHDLSLTRACHDVSEGGLAVAAAEMVISGGYGVELHLKNVPRNGDIDRNDFLLFSESNSRFLVEVPKNLKGEFEAAMKAVPHAQVGEVMTDPQLAVCGLDDDLIVDAELGELLSAWKSYMEREW
jgi:phosphoribosylformylglycinamidine synthase II